MSQVAILGCGPSGLLAAHAVKLGGHRPVVFSEQARPSFITGAQYLHVPIPDVTSDTPDAVITYAKQGSREGYARKVYGAADAACSWDQFPEGLQAAWSLEEMYEQLWVRYGGSRVIQRAITPRKAQELSRLYPLVISTIPLPDICHALDAGTLSHNFPSADIWIRDNTAAPETALHGDPCVVYNGEAKAEHYRSSLLFGHASTEYAHRVTDGRAGVKPLNTDCDCHPKIVRAGRFGEWRKGRLVHHAFERAWEAVHAL